MKGYVRGEKKKTLLTLRISGRFCVFKKQLLAFGFRLSCTCCAAILPLKARTASSVWSIHSSQHLTQVRSRQARIQQLDRLLL